MALGSMCVPPPAPSYGGGLASISDFKVSTLSAQAGMGSIFDEPYRYGATSTISVVDGGIGKENMANGRLYWPDCLFKVEDGDIVEVEFVSGLICEAIVADKSKSMGRFYLHQDYRDGGVGPNTMPRTNGKKFSWCVGSTDIKWLRIKHKKGANYMDGLKEYVAKHRDLFFTIGIVLVLDHFVFQGAFREKLKAIVDSFLDGRAKAAGDGK